MDKMDLHYYVKDLYLCIHNSILSVLIYQY